MKQSYQERTILIAGKVLNSYQYSQEESIMVKLYEGGAYLVHGTEIVPENESAKVTALTGKTVSKEEAKKITQNLNEYNQERQEIEKRIFNEAQKRQKII